MLLPLLPLILKQRTQKEKIFSNKSIEDKEVEIVSGDNRKDEEQGTVDNQSNENEEYQVMTGYKKINEEEYENCNKEINEENESYNKWISEDKEATYNQINENSAVPDIISSKKNGNGTEEGAHSSSNKRKMQVIVNCSESGKHQEELEKIGVLKYTLPMINSYVLEIYEENINQLRGVEGVVKVEQDTHLTAQMKIARQTINGTWEDDKSELGKEVTVAVLDTGLYPHNDFVQNSNRIIDFKDFINNIDQPYDDNGHGTHVAGIIAGDGFESDGKYSGIAPKCNLIGIKVLSEDGSGNISDVLAGVQWVLDNKEKYNIKVMNLSVGMEDNDGENSALVKGVEAAWDQNIVVVCAAGNNGPQKSSVTTPGISRKVITVGASDDAESVTIQGDSISNYSGRGPTKSCIKKPDVVAPGSNIYSCNCETNYKPGKNKYLKDRIGYIKKSGTSMATPMVAGIIARLISDYPNLSNKDIKLNMKYSTNDLGYGQELQGWGLIDMKKIYNRIKEQSIKE